MLSREPATAANQSGTPEILIYPTAVDVGQAVADEVGRIARGHVARSGRFTVALAGGNTPREAYLRVNSDLPWDRIHVFFGDERHVPPDDAASNYKMARESLLSRVPIPDANVHRVHAELQPETAAQEYEDQLREFFPREPFPSLDLVLLGMGSDGHTASLFPGTAALSERSRLVAANWIDKLNQWRITLTLPAFNAASQIMFVVVGGDKAEVLRDVLTDGPGERYPAQLIRPASGSVRWMLDADAARFLSRSSEASAPTRKS